MERNTGLLTRLNTAPLPDIMVVVLLVVMSYLTVKSGVAVGLVVACIPAAVLLLLCLIRNPYWGFMAVFLVNYFVVAAIRYTGIEGWSVIIDIFIALIFISVIVNKVFMDKPKYEFSLMNGLVVASLIWMAYCSLEILNPRAQVDAWLLSRGLVTYMLVMVVITFLTVRDMGKVDSLLMVLSILTLMGVAKAAIQQFVGFDNVEKMLLASGMYKTHLLNSGTRYFSFYASAGIFGVVMGHAMVLYSILALYTKGRGKKIYFLLVAAAACYGLIISGTRGALAVPAVGYLLFVILSKRFRVMISMVVAMVAVYMFLTMTTIGQGNAFVRRMRTAFDPNEPSLVVRRENQKLFGEYLADKPFGEGLGLSGVEAQSTSFRYTTTIPTDSWYVKIWVETGIVGLILHISILLYVVLHGAYIVFCKIKDHHLRGVLIALLCGVAGVLVSSYGNMVLGQYPVVVIVYVSMAIVFMGPYFDKKITAAAQIN